MLLARGKKAAFATSLRSSLALSPRIGFVGVERRGLVYDTRFVPGDPAPVRPFTVLYVLVRGTFAIDEGEVHEGPTVIVIPEAGLEGHDGGRPITYRSFGDPYVAVEIHVRDADLDATAVPRLHAPFFDACERLACSSNDDDALVRAAQSIVTALKAARVVPDDLDPTHDAIARAMTRTWSVVRPLVESLATLSALKGLGGSSSTRQTQRDILALANAFPVVRGGWRPTVHRIRLKLAVLLLSAPSAAPAAVAKEVGYGSLDAMGRAFRDAGLPAPSAVQRELRHSEQ